MTTASIPLTEEQWQFVRAQVESGRYPNAEAVVATALYILEREIEDEPEKLKALLAAATVGFDQLDAGEGINLTDPDARRAWMQQILDEVQNRNGLLQHAQ